MNGSGADCERAVQHLQAGIAELRPGPGAAKPLWRVQGLKGGARAYFVWRFLSQHPRPALLVLPSAKDAEAFVEDLRFFFGEDENAPRRFPARIHYFPAWDIVPFEDLSPTAETIAARIEGLYHLQQTKNPIVVTTAGRACCCASRRASSSPNACATWSKATRSISTRLATELDDWGYRRMPLVEDRGDFSVRGGILDIFPPAHAQPLRIELAGDVIESIREFDPVSQRSLERAPGVPDLAGARVRRRRPHQPRRAQGRRSARHGSRS